MTNYGAGWNEIIITQVIIWFILIGYLINLTVKTKLTHVDEFRQKFIAGIFVLLISSSVFVITQHFFTLSEDFLNFINIFILIGVITSSLLIILGLFRLDEYIYSLIGVQNKLSKLKIFLISIPAPVAVFFIEILLRGVLMSEIVMRVVLLMTYIIFYFVFIYTFFLHKEIKEIKINMMAFFGVGFMFQALNQILAIFQDVIIHDLGNDGLYWVLFQLYYILLLTFLIFGYLNFKNRIKNVG
ncbi:MAG: hypothetical protein ACFFCM_02410 [Promethearchaeota archaeon]